MNITNDISVASAIAAATLTADTNGAGIDGSGFHSITHVIHVGASGDTLSGSVRFDYKIEHSDDNSVWAAVTSADDVVIPDSSSDVITDPDSNGVFATIDDPTEDDAVLKIGYIGPKRYSRVVVDATGTHTNGTPHSALAVLARPRKAPVT